MRKIPKPQARFVAGRCQSGSIDARYWHGRTGIKQGEEHHNAKLDTGDVLAIRSMRDSGVTLREIAEAFEISITTVLEISKGESWKHVP